MRVPKIANPAIDLRSDTITRPSAGMRAAMAAAEVGDDVYGEDPTVNALQQRVAELLGHEAGLFMPSGSMGNLLGLWCLVKPGEEVLCDARAHVARGELGAHAALHGITMRTWSSFTGVADASAITKLISPKTGYLVRTAAVTLENTHNFGGGSVQPVKHLRQISKTCRDQGIGLHLDGARLWNAHVASGVSMADYARLFDTVTVCFSKGLGAPVGAMLVSSADNIERAREQRKRLGGGLRQVGFLAAAANYALDHNVARLAADHAAAAAFAAEVANTVPEAVTAPQTNIVVLDTGATSAAKLAHEAAEVGVKLSVVGPRTVRAVTSLEVTLPAAMTAGRMVGRLLGR
jgi:threonine aldolase